MDGSYPDFELFIMCTEFLSIFDPIFKRLWALIMII
jgi:hypothetical protein